MHIHSLPLDDITIPNNRRPAKDISALAQSIDTVGLLQPITVSEDRVLIAGHRRLCAFRMLGRDTIPAVILPVDDMRARLIEIDENLQRAELTALERAEQLAERKAIYEALHPETRHGGDRRSERAQSKRQDGDLIQPFSESAAAQTGTSRRTVERAVRIAESIPEDLRDALRNTPIADNQKELLALARLEPEEQRAVVQLLSEGFTNVAAAKREHRRRRDAETLDAIVAPTGKYRTLVIDPPWDWGDEGDVSQMGRGVPKYATMPIAELEALPVRDLADHDCHLYLWITNRSLPKGFRLLDAWGFRYITTLTWCKPSIGIGTYFRNNTEHILFGVKGSQRLLRFDVGTWFQAPREGEHSVKPQLAYDLIASCSPAPRLDMFARQEREGFDAWGNA
jgi:N6-adenosine-specific RNA methylase IME4